MINLRLGGFLGLPASKLWQALALEDPARFVVEVTTGFEASGHLGLVPGDARADRLDRELVGILQRPSRVIEESCRADKSKRGVLAWPSLKTSL